VAELADAAGLGPVELRLLEVRVLPPALVLRAERNLLAQIPLAKIPEGARFAGAALLRVLRPVGSDSRLATRLIAADEERERLAHALGDEPDQKHDGEDGGGA
jgi:hypothetical protein